jgi:hypothetical protein
MFSSSSLGKESIEGIIRSMDRLVAWHLTIRLDSMLQAVQLPAGISHLDSGLTDMYGDTFTHFRCFFLDYHEDIFKMNNR